MENSDPNINHSDYEPNNPQGFTPDLFDENPEEPNSEPNSEPNNLEPDPDTSNPDQNNLVFDPADDDEDEDELTAAQVIELMENAWLNERFAPEVLPNKSEIVECLLGQIACMDENLQNLESNDFQKILHQMEVDRLRYLVTSYLRRRLEKIESYAFAVLKQEEAREEKGDNLYLTPGELQFAKDFRDGLEQHFDKVLSFWPGLAPDDWKKEPVAPTMYSFVFLKSKVEIEGVVIDDSNEEDGDLVDFKNGSQMIISYNSVANLVKNGDVQLI